MNVPAGFDTGFSFFYSAVNSPGSVSVYSGLDAGGTLLTTLVLPLTPNNGAPDPSGNFSPLVPIGVTFAGTAMSVDFGGSANQIVFDEITLGSAIAGGGPGPVAPPAAPPIVEELLLVDYSAVISTIHSAIPMALAQRELALAGIETSLRDVNGRLFRLRAGLTDPAGPQGDAPDKEIISIDSRGAKDAKDYKGEPGPRLRAFKVFASGDYGNTDRDSIDSTPGFRQDVYAATAGVEINLSRNFTIGMGGTVLDSNGYIGSTIGKADLQGFSISPYASFHTRSFYLDALYSYGQFEHTIHRDTIFGRTAHADPDSSNHSVQLNAGYNLHVAGFITGPFASLDYTKGELGGYTERDAGRFNTRVNSQNYDSLKSRLGWQASYPVRAGFAILTPQVRASWIHEFADDNEAVTAGLVESPFLLVNASGVRPVGGFAAKKDTRGPGQDALSVGTGLHISLGESFAVLADYEIHLAQSDNLQQFASLRGSVSF
jgi:uncharacterized protein YhjY with autotransporter beta-barrel domain